MTKRAFGLCLFLCLFFLLPCCTAEQDGFGLGVETLAPVSLPGAADAPTVPLQCGPTAQFAPSGLTLDLSQPYVFFGQTDCWAMVASGTADAPGPVGWVQAAAADFPAEPELLFEDAVMITVMEDTALTLTPAGDAPSFADISEGLQAVVLASLGGWAYIQTEADGMPVRGFIPLSSFL